MLRVILEPYQKEYFLPKAFIQTALQGSLFDQALQEDPNAKEIVIPNSDVTPEAMQFLINYNQGKEPERHIPNLIPAEHYLNIPWLLYYIDPMYDQIPDRNNINDPVNRDILDLAIGTDHDLIVGYFMAKGWNPTSEDLVQAYEAADSWKIIRLFLRAGVPLAANIKDEILEQAAESGQLDVVKLLMQNYKIDPSEHRNYALRAASEYNHHAVIRQLLTDPKVDPDAALLFDYDDRYDEETLRILAFDPRTGLLMRHTALWWASHNGYIQLVRELVADPQTEVDSAFISELEAQGELLPEILTLLQGKAGG